MLRPNEFTLLARNYKEDSEKFDDLAVLLKILLKNDNFCTISADEFENIFINYADKDPSMSGLGNVWIDIDKEEVVDIVYDEETI